MTHQRLQIAMTVNRRDGHVHMSRPYDPTDGWDAIDARVDLVRQAHACASAGGAEANGEEEHGG